MHRRAAALIVSAGLAGCAPALLSGAERISIQNAAAPGVAPLTVIRAVHGKGCGLIGYPGSYRGAEATLRNLAFQAGADYVVITREQKPYSDGKCAHNEYVLEAQAYKGGPAPTLASTSGSERTVLAAPAPGTTQAGAAVPLLGAIGTQPSQRTLPQVPSVVLTTRYWTTPVEMQSATVRGLTLRPGERVSLAGDASGSAPLSVDNFLLFIGYRGETEVDVAALGLVGNDGIAWSGKPVRLLAPSASSFAPDSIDLTALFERADRVDVLALDYGGAMGSSAVYLRLLGTPADQDLARRLSVQTYDLVAFTRAQRSVRSAQPALPLPVGSPSTVLGFETAVEGCLPGYLYPLPVGSDTLSPDFDTLVPVRGVWSCEFAGHGTRIDASNVADALTYLTRYQGRFSAAQAGHYELEWTGAPAQVLVDGQLVLDASSGVAVRAAVQLAAGPHTIVVTYRFERDAAFDLGLFVTPPGGARTVLSLRPGTAFYAAQGLHYAAENALPSDWQSYARLSDRTITITQPVHFVSDSATLTPESEPVLFAVANILRSHPSLLRMEVHGHTDDAGSTTYNQDLSERRANAVRNWLVTAGIAPHRVTARGFGKTRPLSPGSDSSARSANRRVEFVFPDGSSAAQGAVLAGYAAGRAVPGTSVPAATATATSPAAIVGKYAYEIFYMPELVRELRALLGKSYKAFEARLQTSDRITRRGEYVVGSGIMPHQGGSEEAYFALGSTNDDWHFAIRQNGKIRILSPGGRPAPQALTEQFDDADERGRALFGR